jgi:FkbM family methyltransferase
MLSTIKKRTIANGIRRYFPKLWMERELRFRPNHFERELWVVPFLCDKGKTALDIGANMGVYSYFMRKFSRQVIAFEPNIDLWSDLHRLLGRDFRIEGAALSNRVGTSTMRIDNTNTGVATIEEKNDLCCVEDKSIVVERAVEVRTLDSFAYSDVAMIKIDVEGHEEAVVAGAVETIQRCRPSLLIESENRHNPGAPRRLADSISCLDYHVAFLKGGKLLDFAELRDADIDINNYVRGDRAYINNFLFIPAENSKKIDQMRDSLSRQ